MIKTLEEVKHDLQMLKLYNNPNKLKFNPEVELRREKIRKERYDSCVERGMLKEAEEIADTLFALKTGEKLKTVSDLEYIYAEAIKKLSGDDQVMAEAVFLDGKDYCYLSGKLHYNYQTIKLRFIGRTESGVYKKGIYGKICDIINGGDG